MVKGKGKYQLDLEEKSTMSILKVLLDGKKHRHKEIKEKTKLNDPTLAKYFNRLQGQKFLEKEIDVKSGKYPYPVYYSINPKALPLLKIIPQIEHEKEEIEKIILDPKKTPLDVLDELNKKNNSFILLALKECKERKDLPQGFINFLLEFFVWNPYKYLSSFLVESSEKIIEKIDVEKLIEQNQRTVCVDKYQFKHVIEDAFRTMGLTENDTKDFMKRSGMNELIGV
jgi:DNA-binding HxlR family transcriptional regulator